MKVGFGNDHASVDMKMEVMEYVKELGHEVVNYGTDEKVSCDYPIYGEKVANAVAAGEVDCGILICGTGIGISMAANKIHGIRAALCHDYFSAKYTRLHNDSNIIAFGARVIGPGLACELLDVFLNTGFEGGRHALRVEKMMNLEKE